MLSNSLCNNTRLLFYYSYSYTGYWTFEKESFVNLLIKLLMPNNDVWYCSEWEHNIVANISLVLLLYSLLCHVIHSFIQHWTQYKLQSMSFRNATTINTRPHWLFWQIFEDKSKHTKFDCSFSISLHGVKEQNSTSSYLYFVRAGESIWNVVGLEGRMFYSVSPFKQVVLVRFPQKSCILNIFSTFCLCNCLTQYPKEASLKIKSID